MTAVGGVTLTGQRPGNVLVSADGTRAVMVTAWPRGRVTWGSYPDGVRGSTTRVAVIDTATGRQVGTTFRTTGTHPAVVQLTADGARAMVTSVDSKTHVAVLNTKTGTKVGSTLTLSGAGSAQLAEGGSRAVVTASAYSPFTRTVTTRIAVLNTTAGTRAGSTFSFAGNGSTLLSPDGTRAVLLSGSATAVINTETGAQVGTPLAGSWSVQAWTADGTRALLINSDYAGADTTTRVGVLDLPTGLQIGTTVGVVGSGSVRFNAATNRAVVTATSTDTPNTTTSMAVFNTVTGTQLGATLTVPGQETVVSSPDGTRLLLTADQYDSATAMHTTRVTVVDTVTGAVAGSLTLTGNPYGRDPEFSSDGTRAAIITDVYDPISTLHTSRVTMMDTVTGAQVGTTLTFVGSIVAETMWRPDGARALVTVTPTQYDSVESPMLVAVVDSAGAQVGTTLSLSGMPGYLDQPVWSPDGTRALITTNDYDQLTGVNTIRVTTVNTTSGGQIGAAVIVTSGASGSRTVMIPAIGRALVTAGNQLTVINTVTGGQVGASITFEGTPSTSVFSADGTRALMVVGNTLTVIDTTTGAQIGSPTSLTFGDSRMIVAQLAPDGTHVLVTTTRQSYGGTGVPSSPVAVVDLTTGSQAGTTLVLDGDIATAPALTADGSHAIITTDYYDTATGISSTEVTTVDPRTGMQVGEPITLSGVLSPGFGNPTALLSSPDGTRALLATTSPARYNNGQITVVDTATGKQVGDVVAIDGGITGLRWSPDGTRVVVTSIILTTTGADRSVRVTILDAS